MADITKDSVILSAFFTESEMKDCVNRNGIFYVLSGRNEGDLGKSYVCAVDSVNGTAKWNSAFNGTPGNLFLTSDDSLAVTSGNDLYLYNCDDGYLIGNYSLTADKTGIVMQSFNEDRQPIMLKYEIYDKAKLLEMAEYKLDYYNYEH